MTITDTTTETATPSRPTHLNVAADHTAGEHVTDSDDIWWWLPILGPTATVLAYNLARYARHSDVTWPVDALAQRIGLGKSKGLLWRSLDRLDTFHVARFHSTDLLTIRLELPILSQRQLAKLPEDLAANYPHPARVVQPRPRPGRLLISLTRTDRPQQPAPSNRNNTATRHRSMGTVENDAHQLRSFTSSAEDVHRRNQSRATRRRHLTGRADSTPIGTRRDRSSAHLGASTRQPIPVRVSGSRTPTSEWSGVLSAQRSRVAVAALTGGCGDASPLTPVKPLVPRAKPCGLTGDRRRCSPCGRARHPGERHRKDISR